MCKREKTVYLLGIGMGSQSGFTEEVREALLKCGCIIGAARMVQSALDGISKVGGQEGKQEEFSKETFIEYRAETIARFVKEHQTCTVFAVVLSGDSGFYSGAKSLAQELKGVRVKLLPGISTVSYLAAKIGTSWEDAKVVSLHGQKANFIYEITHHEKTFLLLGTKGQGRTLCEKLKKYALADVQVTIGKNLSYAEEELITKKAGELVPEDWEGLSVALVVNPHPVKRYNRAVEDAEFIRGKVPMTKAEVRTVCLAKLRLAGGAVLYDIGAGTGSISVEAALSGPDIRVYAIEKKPEAVQLLEENKRKFAADWMEIVQGTAPEAMEGLEQPSHIFIGGSSGNLKEILYTALTKNPKVRIVMTAISLETVKEAVEAMEEGLLPSAEVVQITVAKSRKLGSFHMMMGENPVYVISAGGEEGL
ncbi:precorrin-6Y C5,15-methyltransferase (decarboxylating) subunit CbiT [Mediterraneibacter sp. NSJ-55]|uniref:Precorrin-6Y C5,15-methyltransferase (Decarboxylating) subunit CbiT n=1 Tax=Mediterraneibacter hominis TaxID=2763054 RepID=A0A923RPD7_9FIRM|nr:precorrin-6Y C5,15-methyltransferase (decarboxylating) subunit CbiT [Mediterraneibacter hominis]MBC5688409.1 precorrin-6Y C5,15-methyltransferase (decarboxylating) subunit CbiT [Mediterraneibacter hominis]